MRRSLTITVAILLSLGFVASGCSSDKKSDTATTGTTESTATPVTGTITVSAAASLTEAFGTIKDDFVKANPGADITINFGSSGTLETQIESGAPADVAAFADEATMKKLSDKSLLAAPAEIFATNQLVIVTKPGNPKGIKTLADLATAGTISLCADTAPCGKYANQILQTAGVTIPTVEHHPGPGRQGHDHGGQRGRCRGRHRLRDRRAGRRRQGGHGRDPRRPERGGQVPDRGAQGDDQQRRWPTPSWSTCSAPRPRPC